MYVPPNVVYNSQVLQQTWLGVIVGVIDGVIDGVGVFVGVFVGVLLFVGVLVGVLLIYRDWETDRKSVV